MKKPFKGLKIGIEFYSRDMPWHVPILRMVKAYLIIPGILINLQPNNE
jgi:hypothetical protein